jgi:hypothetical protein
MNAGLHPCVPTHLLVANSKAVASGYEQKAFVHADVGPSPLLEIPGQVPASVVSRLERPSETSTAQRRRRDRLGE